MSAITHDKRSCGSLRFGGQEINLSGRARTLVGLLDHLKAARPSACALLASSLVRLATIKGARACCTCRQALPYPQTLHMPTSPSIPSTFVAAFWPSPGCPYVRSNRPTCATCDFLLLDREDAFDTTTSSSPAWHSAKSN